MYNIRYITEEYFDCWKEAVHYSVKGCKGCFLYEDHSGDFEENLKNHVQGCFSRVKNVLRELMNHHYLDIDGNYTNCDIEKAHAHWLRFQRYFLTDSIKGLQTSIPISTIRRTSEGRYFVSTKTARADVEGAVARQQEKLRLLDQHYPLEEFESLLALDKFAISILNKTQRKFTAEEAGGIRTVCRGCERKIKTGRKVVELLCGHLYHKKCAAETFTVKPVCGVCRKYVAVDMFRYARYEKKGKCGNVNKWELVENCVLVPFKWSFNPDL